MRTILPWPKLKMRRKPKKFLGWLRDLINETYEKRDHIEPNYSMTAELKALDIFKLLPGTNCKKCRIGLPCVRR